MERHDSAPLTVWADLISLLVLDRWLLWCVGWSVGRRCRGSSHGTSATGDTHEEIDITDTAQR
jgi:hypothetical protein